MKNTGAPRTRIRTSTCEPADGGRWTVDGGVQEGGREVGNAAID